MNRDEYLRQLRGYLNNMPDDEAEDVIEYYFEYLTDAGMDSEADIISELGTPDKLAQTINDDYRKMNEYIDEQDNNSKNEVILYQSSFYNNHRRAYNHTSYNNTQRSYGNTGYNNAQGGYGNTGYNTAQGDYGNTGYNAQGRYGNT